MWNCRRPDRAIRGTLIIIVGFLSQLLSAQPAPPLLEIAAAPASVTLDNPVFSEASVSVGITIGHSGGPTGYFLTLSRGQSSTFEPRQMRYSFFFDLFSSYLSYNLYTPAGTIIRDLSGPVSNQEVLSGNFGNTGSGYTTAEQTLELRIPASQMVRRGTYRDEVILSLYQGRPSQPQRAQLVAQQPITLRSTTPTVAQIAIGGEAVHTFDFGFLTEGSTRQTELLFRSNSAYRIDATSENRGVMVNVFQEQSNSVPYQLRVDGSTINLVSPALVRLGLLVAGSGTEFESVPLSVTIGAVEDVMPGLFQDVITFTISTF